MALGLEGEIREISRRLGDFGLEVLEVDGDIQSVGRDGCFEIDCYLNRRKRGLF